MIMSIVKIDHTGTLFQALLAFALAPMPYLTDHSVRLHQFVELHSWHEFWALYLASCGSMLLAGCVFNADRLRRCFLVWMVAFWAAVAFLYGADGGYSPMNACFVVFALMGFITLVKEEFFGKRNVFNNGYLA